MSDGTAAAALGGTDGNQGVDQAAAAAPGTPAPAPAAAPAVAAPGGEPAPAVPSWMESLPADSPYRQNADLLRMQSVDDLAKGYAETRAWAKGRIAIPTDEAGWAELGQKLRGENIEAYKIEVPDGQDRALADSFKQFAFDNGLPPRWAEATANFYNQQTAQQLSLIQQENNSAIESVKIEFGPAGFAMRAEAVNKMLANAGVEGVDVIDGLQQMLSTNAEGKAVPGAGAAIRALFTLAEKTGELGKVDGADVQLRMGSMSAPAAKAEIDRRSSDMTPEGRKWMEQAAITGTPQHRTWQELNMAQARGQ